MFLPPYGIKVLDTWGYPFLNTLVLLNSGFSITWAHHALRNQRFNQAREGIVITILLAIFFTNLQELEYLESEFNINDGIYGSVFFLITDSMVFM